LLPQLVRGPLPGEPEHAFIHHHAPAETHHVTERPHHHPGAP